MGKKRMRMTSDGRCCCVLCDWGMIFVIGVRVAMQGVVRLWRNAILPARASEPSRLPVVDG